MRKCKTPNCLVVLSGQDHPDFCPECQMRRDSQPLGKAQQAFVPPPAQLSFARLRSANVNRTADAFHPVHEWSPTDWATAMAGECGEACNLVKKLRRGEDINPRDIAHELADLVIYADLLAARLDIDLGAAVVEKFNIVSDRPRPVSEVRL